MRFILLLIAAVIAVAAGVAALHMSSKNAPAPTVVVAPSQPQQVSTVDVLVARVPIEIGAVIDSSMVDRQPWPQHLVLDGFITANGKNADIIGKVARSPFLAREPIMADKLANPNDPSFLAANLAQGMRAVTIATDAVAGVAGYVFPGDHVDILFTHNVPQEISAQYGGGTVSSGKPLITEVLVPNARVLAVNVRDVSGKPGSPAPSSITIEAADATVQKLRLAEKNGTLSLALRSLKDKDNPELPDPTLLESLTRVEQSEQIKVSR